MLVGARRPWQLGCQWEFSCDKGVDIIMLLKILISLN